MEADGNMGEGERNKKTRQVWRGALLSACLLACGLSVNAFVPESVSLKGEGNKVDVQMSPVEKDTVSLQLSMEVQVTKGASAASVSFEFDQGLAGSVKEYRYQEETGVLTIYVSGDGNKSFPEGEDFRLGNVVLNSESGEATEATVRVKTDSLRIVNRGYDMQVRKEIYAPGEEKAVAGSDQKQPEPENPDSEPDVVPKPEDPPGEDESQDKTEGTRAAAKSLVPILPQGTLLMPRRPKALSFRSGRAVQTWGSRSVQARKSLVHRIRQIR